MVIGFSNGRIQADQSQFIRLFLTKNTQWKHQKEWRLIGDASSKPKAPRIKRIYLGKHIDDENKEKMRAFCVKHSIEILER